MYLVAVRTGKNQHVMEAVCARSKREAASLARQIHRGQRVEIAWVGPDLAHAIDRMRERISALEKQYQEAVQELDSFDYRHYSGYLLGLRFALRLLEDPRGPGEPTPPPPTCS